MLSTGLGLLSAATLGAAVTSSVPTAADYSSGDIVDGTAFQDVASKAEGNMQFHIGHRSTQSDCTYDSASVRKEWRTLDQDTRKSFTDAVTCLSQMEPTHMSQDQAGDYPGVKSRYDEFIATHINYTMNIHNTADFLAWHRTFIHFWEQDLINLCGYTGVLPYWNWAMDADAPQDSPLFTGDEYSMGSNGKYIDGRSDTWLATMVSSVILQDALAFR